MIEARVTSSGGGNASRSPALRLVAVEHQDLALVLDARVADLYVQQEAIELRFGQRIRALLLDRVLRRHNQEELGSGYVTRLRR